MAHYFALGMEDLVLECFLLVRNELMDFLKLVLCGVQERLVELIVFDVNKHEFVAQRKPKAGLILLPHES